MIPSQFKPQFTGNKQEMRVVLIVIAAAILSSCGTYKGNETWRRSTCNQISDVDERARCLEEATRPENEYKQDVEDALKNES